MKNWQEFKLANSHLRLANLIVALPLLGVTVTVGVLPLCLFSFNCCRYSVFNRLAVDSFKSLEKTPVNYLAALVAPYIAAYCPIFARSLGV